MNPWQGQVPCHPVEVASTVYVEVPKAGCSSVKWALSAFKGGPPLDGRDIHGWFGYTHARDVDELYTWLETRWRQLFRFTVVRDPIARFVSFYYGLQAHERGAWGDIDRYVAEGLDEWTQDIHCRPQTDLIGDQLERFDAVLKIEDTAKLEASLRDHISPDIVFPHMNRASRVAPAIAPSTAKRLRKLYARDLEVLGYG